MPGIWGHVHRLPARQSWHGAVVLCRRSACQLPGPFSGGRPGGLVPNLARPDKFCFQLVVVCSGAPAGSADGLTAWSTGERCRTFAEPACILPTRKPIVSYTFIPASSNGRCCRSSVREGSDPCVQRWPAQLLSCRTGQARAACCQPGGHREQVPVRPSCSTCPAVALL